MTTRKEKYSLSPSPIDKGGQAEVYKAIEKATGRIVALKRVNSRDDESIARMKREIDVQSSLKHPNIMPIYDASSRYVWYTMPLATHVLGKLQTPISDEIIFNFVIDCAKGLEAAHNEKYFHRDITPKNILLINEDGYERWVVADWGLVRKRDHTTVIRTQTGIEFGTAGYAAPESWTDAHNANSTSDIYSLGRVVAWSITGEVPIPNIPLIPDGKWKKFVTFTTKINKDERIQSMQEVIEFISQMGNPLPQQYDQKTLPEIKILLQGLNHTDTQIFVFICQLSIKINTSFIQLEDVYNRFLVFFPESEIDESIEMLLDEGYISGDRTLDGKIHAFTITPTGFEQFSEYYLSSFENTVTQILDEIVNQKNNVNFEIQKKLDIPIILVDYAIDILETKGLLSTSKTLDGRIYVDDISIRGRRLARKKAGI